MKNYVFVGEEKQLFVETYGDQVCTLGAEYFQEYGYDAIKYRLNITQALAVALDGENVVSCILIHIHEFDYTHLLETYEYIKRNGNWLDLDIAFYKDTKFLQTNNRVAFTHLDYRGKGLYRNLHLDAMKRINPDVHDGQSIINEVIRTKEAGAHFMDHEVFGGYPHVPDIVRLIGYNGSYQTLKGTRLLEYLPWVGEKMELPMYQGYGASEGVLKRLNGYQLKHDRLQCLIDMYKVPEKYLLSGVNVVTVKRDFLSQII